MKTAICFDNVKKSYQRQWRGTTTEALKGISFSIEQGETFGFVGPNGAGKSTAIKILVGVLQPTSGSVMLFGKSAADPSGRRGMGFVPENPSLQDYLTPCEILMMGLKLHRVELDRPRSYCCEWLEKFGLKDVVDRPIRGFSKGMAQRTALAHALAIKPRVLILDEPLSGLDPLGRRDVVDILSDYKKSGGTLFFTSHVLHDVERLADRFGLIHQGVLQAVRSPAELVGAEDFLVVRTLGERSVEGMVSEFTGRWRAEVTRADFWGLMNRIESAGHSVIEIRPTLSLERAFMQAVGAEGSPARS